MWLLIARFALISSALGLGHSLLAYAAVIALADDNAGRSLKTLGTALLRDWKRALLLAIPLTVPSLLVTLSNAMFNIAFIPQASNFARAHLLSLTIFGIPLLLITAFITALRWSLAPIVMFRVAWAIAALRRSAKIVQAQRSGMFYLLLTCGLIGWLIVSVPAAASSRSLRCAVLPGSRADRPVRRADLGARQRLRRAAAGAGAGRVLSIAACADGKSFTADRELGSRASGGKQGV